MWREQDSARLFSALAAPPRCLPSLFALPCPPLRSLSILLPLSLGPGFSNPSETLVTTHTPGHPQRLGISRSGLGACGSGSGREARQDPTKQGLESRTPRANPAPQEVACGAGVTASPLSSVPDLPRPHPQCPYGLGVCQARLFLSVCLSLWHPQTPQRPADERFLLGPTLGRPRPSRRPLGEPQLPGLTAFRISLRAPPIPVTPQNSSIRTQLNLDIHSGRTAILLTPNLPVQVSSCLSALISVSFTFY